MNPNTRWTDEERQVVITHILGEVASGRALTRVLDEDEGMPGKRTFWAWHFADEDLQHNLARAREAGVEVHLEEALEIADADPATYSTENGERIDPGDIAHRKNQIETRIKRAQMIAPRKYGPKIDLTSGNEPLAAPATGDVSAGIAALLEDARRRKEREEGGGK